MIYSDRASQKGLMIIGMGKGTSEVFFFGLRVQRKFLLKMKEKAIKVI